MNEKPNRVKIAHVLFFTGVSASTLTFLPLNLPLHVRFFLYVGITGGIFNAYKLGELTTYSFNCICRVEQAAFLNTLVFAIIYHSETA